MIDMITVFPDMPPLGESGKAPRPLVVLLGGRNGSGEWQARAAVTISRKVPSAGVVCTHRSQVPYAAWQMLVDVADYIVAWCGSGSDCLYLEEWVHLGYAAGKKQEALLGGVHPGVDHPMRGAIDGLVTAVFTDDVDLTEAVARRCGETRT